MRRELLPNATSVLLVEFALRAGYAPVLIGSLGFLGFGLRPPTPEWGLMISENRALIIISPITVLGPGLALASLVVGLNLFTEGLARILGRTVRLGDAVSALPLLSRSIELSVSYRQGGGWLRGGRRRQLRRRAGARSSAWSANPAAASRPSRCSFSAIASRQCRIDGGQVLFEGSDLLSLERAGLDRLRGDRISFVPQNPTTALNPGHPRRPAGRRDPARAWQVADRDERVAADT